MRTHSAALAPGDLEDYPVARRDHTAQHLHQYYLDQVAKSAKTAVNTPGKIATQHCGAWAVVGYCENSHHYAKKLNCGRDWCELCREQTEARRVARWLPKVQQISSMGYWVISPPRDIACLMRSKKVLSKFAKKVCHALKKIGYQRGLDRWHFFGDKDNEYYPHLNVLVDGGWIDPEDLERLKAELRRMIYSKYLRERYHDKLDINYGYRPTPARMMHTLRYVVKATFLNQDWDPQLTDQLYNFRNCGWWGKWDQAPKWHIQAQDDHAAAVAELANGICPICRTKITWDRKPTPMAFLLALGAVELPAGYYFVPNLRGPPGIRASPHPDLPANPKA